MQLGYEIARYQI